MLHKSEHYLSVIFTYTLNYKIIKYYNSLAEERLSSVFRLSHSLSHLSELQGLLCKEDVTVYGLL